MAQVIRSLLDTDLYKFTMSAFARRYYPYVTAKLALISRSNMRLDVDPLRLQGLLDIIAKMKPTIEEMAYLQQETGISPLHLADLYPLPRATVVAADDCVVGGVEVEGPWWQVMMWETYIMSTLAEEHYASVPFGRGSQALMTKLARLRADDDLAVVDFGTRRRHSARWHEVVLEMLGDRLRGTSNVHFARTLGLQPIGTMAHEVFMVPAALASNSPRALRGSPQLVMEQWREMWGDKYSVALTDTFGTPSFLRDMTQKQAQEWGGLRQDSGDPYVWANEVLAFYGRMQVRNPLLVFSDGLTLPTIESLAARYGSRARVTFGWGTNLTCDMGPDHEPLDVVVKVVEANGHKTVKLSDSPGKALGDDAYKYAEVFAQ